MTQNQIAYHNAIELERHNRAAESETQRHQKVSEALENWKNKLTAWSIAETHRSNLQQEELKRQQNVVNAAGLSETLRHNMEMESITKQQTASQSALNQALEGQAAATAASSYALASLNSEKINTEKSVQSLNTTQAGYTNVQRLNYPYQVDYIVSQRDLNNAQVVRTKADTKRVEMSTLHEGVSTVWDSVKGALNLMFSGKSLGK